MNVKGAASCLLTFVRHSCYRASIARNPRPLYTRLYQIRLVRPDGSSIRIPYHEPASIIKLPLDINLLNEEERRRRLIKRQMKGTVKTKEQAEFETIKTFDPRQYLNIKK